MGEINSFHNSENRVDNIILTHHARLRLSQRNINIDDIKKCLNNPDFKDILEEEKQKAIKNIDGRKLLVIYKRIGNIYLIITVYYK